MEHEPAPRIELARSNNKATDDQSEKPCHLLNQMPPELRNEIRKLALSYADGVVIDCVTRKLLPRNPLALTMTCKQISRECEGIFFEQNELRLQILEHQPFYETLRRLDNFSNQTLRLSPFYSRFRKIQVESGDVVTKHSYAEKFRRALECALPLIIASQQDGKQVRWSHNMRVRGKNIAFDIPMSGKEEAWRRCQALSVASTLQESRDTYGLPSDGGSTELSKSWKPCKTSWNGTPTREEASGA